MGDQKDNETQEESQTLTPSEEAFEEEPAFESASVHPKQVLVTDEELKKLQKEISEYKDKYLRLLADADNSRKRMQKEKQELTRYAMETLIVQFLPPLDNLENALGFAEDMSDEVRNWAFGFQMILAQFKDILAQNGVASIEAKGQAFNPHLHEAIEMVESTTEYPGIIIEECVRGYKMGEKVIRPARVKVAKGKDEGIESEEINKNTK